MPEARQVEPPRAAVRGPVLRWVSRIAATVAVALLVGTTASAAMRWDSRFHSAPGFGRGLLHGALMPLAWPTLLAGRDQSIYAEPNSGRTYKLGYSLGVNACGLAFFGWFFARVRRWTARPGLPTT